MVVFRQKKAFKRLDKDQIIKKNGRLYEEYDDKFLFHYDITDWMQR
jgi:hypothetical protein